MPSGVGLEVLEDTFFSLHASFLLWVLTLYNKSDADVTVHGPVKIFETFGLCLPKCSGLSLKPI